MPRDRKTDEERPPQFFIGPNTPNDPESLLKDARDRVRKEDERNKESSRLARRLFVALLLIVMMGIVFYLVLPYFGLRLPPLVPLLCYAAIAAGAILSFRDA